MRQESRLVAGEVNLREFCLEIFSIPDPIIVIWVSKNKPTELNEEAKKNEIDDMHIFLKEHLDSLFFPLGFVVKEWNLVVASVKEEHVGDRSYSQQLIKGWMMGTDINSQAYIDGKFLVRLH